MADNAFLSERRKQVVQGLSADEIGIADGTRRYHRATAEQKARKALGELTLVAASPEIDNAEVFEPEAIEHLLRLLLVGRTNIVNTDAFEVMESAMLSITDGERPNKEYAQSVYSHIDRAKMYYQFYDDESDMDEDPIITGTDDPARRGDQ